MKTRWTRTEIVEQAGIIWVELGKRMRPEMGFKLGYSGRGGDIVIDGRQAIPQTWKSIKKSTSFSSKVMDRGSKLSVNSQVL